MNEPPSLPWPLWMIALDVVGTLLFAFGLFGLLSADGPAEFDGLAIAAIIVGVTLMLPFLVTLIRAAMSRAKSG